jgi:hypothetical protein
MNTPLAAWQESIDLKVESISFYNEFHGVSIHALNYEGVF